MGRTLQNTMINLGLQNACDEAIYQVNTANVTLPSVIEMTLIVDSITLLRLLSGGKDKLLWVNSSQLSIAVTKGHFCLLCLLLQRY